MSQFDAAVIKEQGVTFAVVAVKRHVFNTNSSLNEAKTSFQPYFPGMPVVLMRQDSHGRSEYYGRQDLVKFLSHVHPSRMPWRRCTVN